MISGLALFPGGATGAGLLLLRLSVATSLVVLSILRFGGDNLLQIPAVLAAIAICAGFCTRGLAGVSLVVPLLGFAAGAGSVPLAALHSIDVLALVLTGPGAWSADAISFGRRTITLPDRDKTSS